MMTREGPALLAEHELTEPERRLCREAANGRLLDLRAKGEVGDSPAKGRGWGNDRQVRAQLLQQLLTGTGSLDLAFGAPRAVRLQGASIVGVLNVGSMALRCPLDLRDCYVQHPLDFARTALSYLGLRGCYLARRFNGRGMIVEGDVNLDDMVCAGGVRISHAQIRGYIRIDGSRISRMNGRALNAYGATVGGSFFCRRSQVAGEVRLHDAKIGHMLSFEGSAIENPGKPALEADRLNVGSTLSLRRTIIQGEVRLLGSRVGGQFSASDCQIKNPRGRAMTADRMQVAGSIILRRGAIEGELRWPMINVGGAVTIYSGSLCNSGAQVLNLSRAVVSGAAYLRPTTMKGGVDLGQARVGVWYDDSTTWPDYIRLEGFTYDALESADAISARRRLTWLERDDRGYSPQPYEQLASAYRRTGRDDSARIVSIEKERRRRSPVLSRPWRWGGESWSALLRWTIGYGYQPTRVLPYLLSLLVLGATGMRFAYPEHVSLKPGAVGAFNAYIYTLDLLLPVVNLKQRDLFSVDGWATWWVLGLTLAGWLIAAVVVAGLTGLFRRN